MVYLSSCLTWQSGGGSRPPPPLLFFLLFNQSIRTVCDFKQTLGLLHRDVVTVSPLYGFWLQYTFSIDPCLNTNNYVSILIFVDLLASFNAIDHSLLLYSIAQANIWILALKRDYF